MICREMSIANSLVNVILCFRQVSTASRNDSSYPIAKMSLHRILPWIWCFLITSECYNVKNRGEDGSKLIRIAGDIILGGIFPMHEQVSHTNFTTLTMRYVMSSLNYRLVDNFKIDISSRKVLIGRSN